MRVGLPWLPIEVVIRRRAAGTAPATLRGLMTAIAVLAVLLGLGMHLAGLTARAGRLGLLSRDYARRSDQAAWLATSCRNVVRAASDQAAVAETEGDRRSASDQRAISARFAESAGRLDLRAGYFQALAKKYRAAQGRPLLPVWPDPTEPEP